MQNWKLVFFLKNPYPTKKIEQPYVRNIMMNSVEIEKCKFWNKIMAFFRHILFEGRANFSI